MFFYHWQLAWRSLKKNPILCGLMVLAIASGVATSMTCYTAYHLINTNPLSNKDATLFMVQTDSWQLGEAYNGLASNQMPDRFSYRDATTLIHSPIPIRKTAMTRWGGLLSDPQSIKEPFFARARINTRDYFQLFNETFLYGGPWNTLADESTKNYMVLSEAVNQKFFNGKNSVGEHIFFEGKTYTITGVLKINPLNIRIQNIDIDIRRPTEDIYLPFGLFSTYEIFPWDKIYGPNLHIDDQYKDSNNLMNNLDLSLSVWVEFDRPEKKIEFERFVQTYIYQQKEKGYYPRPLKFALLNATEKLRVNGYGSGQLSILTLASLAFFFLCTANCVTIMLTKILYRTRESGIRRALGASRRHIFLDHFCESALIGLLGALFGILLTYSALSVLRSIFGGADFGFVFYSGNPAELLVPDTHILFATIFLSICASLAAGIYPAWQVCRSPIGLHLKTQ